MQASTSNVLFGLAAVALVGAAVLQGSGSTAAIIPVLAALLLACAGTILLNARRGALATATLCLGSNGYLLKGKLGAAGSSICNVNDVLNCDVVNTSAASELFGVPVTMFGVAFYAGLAIAALMGKQTPRFHQVNGLFALASLFFSAYLAFEATKLTALCVMCITIYVGNGLLLWAAFRGLNVEEGSLTSDLPGVAGSTSFVTIAAVFVLGQVMWPALESKARSTRPRVEIPKPDPTGKVAPPPSSAALSALFHQIQGDAVSVDDTTRCIGNQDAPYLLLEFADYGCPHCARAAIEVKMLVDDHPEILSCFRPFPLTSQCNPSMTQDRGPDSCMTALAADCAGEQDRFWDMSNLLFANQNRRSEADLQFMAQQVGLDKAAWETCMASPEANARLVEHANAGARSGLQGTPAFFLRGTHGDTWIQVWDVSAAATLVEAHQAGIDLPPPGPPTRGH